jgi:hypothetical protein
MALEVLSMASLIDWRCLGKRSMRIVVREPTNCLEWTMLGSIEGGFAGSGVDGVGELFGGVDDEHRHDGSLVGDYELMGFWALEGPGWVVSFPEGAFRMFKGAFIWGVLVWADEAVRAVGG